jgi:hypothetical protein
MDNAEQDQVVYYKKMTRFNRYIFLLNYYVN